MVVLPDGQITRSGRFVGGDAERILPVVCFIGQRKAPRHCHGTPCGCCRTQPQEPLIVLPADCQCDARPPLRRWTQCHGGGGVDRPGDGSIHG